jgi:hypothetical protein
MGLSPAGTEFCGSSCIYGVAIGPKKDRGGEPRETEVHPQMRLRASGVVMHCIAFDGLAA